MWKSDQHSVSERKMKGKQKLPMTKNKKNSPGLSPAS
jgi:hypothetical protein